MKNFLVLALCFLGTTWSFQFEVTPGKEKCFGDEIEADSIVSGEFKLLEPIQLHVDLYIFGPNKHMMFRRHKIEEGKFAFESEIKGAHSFCFTTRRTHVNNKKGINQIIEFEYRHGMGAQDYEAIAKRENLSPIEREVRKMKDLVEEIHRDLNYAKVREEQMRDTNENTNSRIMWFSVFSMAVLLTAGMLQLRSLKDFFIKKKIL